MKGRKKNRGIYIFKKLLWPSVIILPIIVVILGMINPKDSTFSVSIITERIEFIANEDDNKIVLYDVAIFDYDGFKIDPKKEFSRYVGDDNKSISGFTGTFKIAEDAIVVIERIASGGLSIQIEVEEKKSVGTFYSDDQDEVTMKFDHDFIEFYIDDIEERVKKGQTIIIPIHAKGNGVTLGRSVYYETINSSTAITRSGEVRVIGRSSFEGKPFIADSYDLKMGDQFKLTTENDNKAFGFVVINEDSAMYATYKTIGQEGRITTPGPLDENSGYVISASLISQYANDPSVKRFSLFLAFLVSIASILPLFEKKDYENRDKVKRRAKKKK